MKSFSNTYWFLFVIILFFGKTVNGQESIEMIKESSELSTANKVSYENDSLEKISKDEIILQQEKDKIALLKKRLERNSTKTHPQDEVLSPSMITAKKADIQKKEVKVKALEASIQTRKQILAGTKEN